MQYDDDKQMGMGQVDVWLVNVYCCSVCVDSVVSIVLLLVQKQFWCSCCCLCDAKICPEFWCLRKTGPSPFWSCVYFDTILDSETSSSWIRPQPGSV